MTKKRNSKSYDRGWQDGRQSIITDRRYNGWTNYETWNVNLWIDNDQGSQEYWRERAGEAYEQAIEEAHITRLGNASIALSDQLKADYEENMPELTGTYADLLRGALSEVNWYEIAENMVLAYKSENSPV